MLKRTASNLFWLTRYLERAEWRTRLLEANYRLLVESPQPTADAWWPLLGVTGEWDLFSEHYAAYDERSILSFFALDPNNRSSISSCIEYARENCRAARHRISSELWLEINRLYLESKGWSFEQMHPAGLLPFFAGLSNCFYRLAGIMHSTLPRDAAFDFLNVGRWLESAENVTRLLDAKYHFLLPETANVAVALDFSQWTALLRSASALEPYCSTYGNAISAEQVVDLLLFSRTFPRAARFSVERLESALERIASDIADDPPVTVPTLLLLGKRLRADGATDVIARGLHDYLLALQDGYTAMGHEIFNAYFQYE